MSAGEETSNENWCSLVGEGENPFDVWFGSLPEGRQNILREDKWLFAEAAFEAGKQVSAYQLDKLIAFHYVAKRDVDGTNWGGNYYSGSRTDMFVHAEAMGRAFRARTPDALKEDMCQMLCDGRSWSERQAGGSYTIMKVVRNNVIEILEQDFCPLDHRRANPNDRGFAGLRTDAPGSRP
jgi:hypothetical protein